MLLFRYTIETRTKKFIAIKYKIDQPIYLVHEAITYELSDGSKLNVPVGFPTDGATVPWMLRWWFPQMGRYTRASVAHDYLYDNRLGDRKVADQEFLKWMLEDNVPKWKAKLFYYAVRLGGKRWWNSVTEKTVTEVTITKEEIKN